MRPALNKKLEVNKQIEETNAQLVNSNRQLNEERVGLLGSLTHLNEQKTTLNKDIQTLQDYKKTQESNLQKDLDTKLKLLEMKFQEAEQACIEEYEELMSDSAADSSLEIQETQKKIDALTRKMNKLQSSVRAAQNEYKRSLEEAQKEDYYKIKLSSDDLREIDLIKSIAPHLRDPLPINKIVWAGYYRAAFNLLKGRVIGNETKIGIYKLINNIDKRVYIGQSRDIATRWADHIKAGLGAAAAPNNKLYNSMRDVGPHNFSYILLEECSAEELNEKEKFWIEFYDSKNLGLNDTKGNGE